jgi:hypothetical protein
LGLVERMLALWNRMQCPRLRLFAAMTSLADLAGYTDGAPSTQYRTNNLSLQCRPGQIHRGYCFLNPRFQVILD